VRDQVDAAIAAGRALNLRYLGAVRDQVTERLVDPIALVMVDGHAYLRAFCRVRGEVRLFRTDRVLAATVSTEPRDPVPTTTSSVESMATTLSGTGLRIVVDLAKASTHADRHPVLRRWALDDGGMRVEIPVGDYEWVRKLMLASGGTLALREPPWLVEELLGTVADLSAPATAPLPAAPPGSADRSMPPNSAE
jgi:proteasome accessory factor C